MGSLLLQGVSKSFEGKVALHPLQFSLDSGRFFALLGPSGCGKTTLLRMIAGLLSPDHGKIFIGDRDVTRLPPEKRNIGMVFQNYALFPHLTVFQNVAFGLKLQGLSGKELEKKVHHALEMVDLAEYAKRPAPLLSGGEQQRVALARALVTEPSVLLFDEPLSNLDARLRIETRLAIRKLVSQLKITTIYVTHDQEEALSLADELGVMHAGILVQHQTPEKVYETPATPFIASFLGRANLIPAKKLQEWEIQFDSGFRVKTQEISLKTDAFLVLIRPEDLLIVSSVEEAWVGGPIVAREFLGSHFRIQIQPQPTGKIWEALIPAQKACCPLGEILYLKGKTEKLRFYEKEDR